MQTSTHKKKHKNENSRAPKTNKWFVGIPEFLVNDFLVFGPSEIISDGPKFRTDQKSFYQ